MFDKRVAFRQELHRIERFTGKVGAHRAQTTPASYSGDPGADDYLQHVSVAFEDIPEDMHEEVRVILMHPTENKSLRDHVLDIAKNAAGGTAGELERLSCLHILSILSTHDPYTYSVDAKVIRGSRPTPDKLSSLYDKGCRATINLCEEMRNGDDDLIDAAHLTGQMQTRHIKIIDNTPPTPAQVTELFNYLDEIAGPVYVHCEAGVGRTGVMVACHRMYQGWPLAAALQEAKQFGCAMPDQLAFIENRASAPRKPDAPVSHQPADAVLSETATMNKDPIGLDRVLASIAASTGSARVAP